MDTPQTTQATQSNEPQGTQGTPHRLNALIEFEKLKAMPFDILRIREFRAQMDRAIFSTHAWLESLEQRIGQLEKNLEV